MANGNSWFICTFSGACREGGESHGRVGLPAGGVLEERNLRVICCFKPHRYLAFTLRHMMIVYLQLRTVTERGRDATNAFAVQCAVLCVGVPLVWTKTLITRTIEHLVLISLMIG